MKKWKHIVQLMIGLIQVVVVFISYTTSLLESDASNTSLRLFFAIVWFLFWFASPIAKVLGLKYRLRAKISPLFFVLLQVLFWSNGLFLLVCKSKESLWVLNNSVVAVFILVLSMVIYNDYQPRIGKATWREIETLKTAIAILQSLEKATTSAETYEFLQISDAITIIIEHKIKLIHGIESYILKECEALSISFYTKDMESISYHKAMLLVLVNYQNNHYGTMG